MSLSAKADGPVVITSQFNRLTFGALDTPPSRGMTASRKTSPWLERRAAQEVGRLHRRFSGALQFDDPDCPFATGNGQPVVQHRTRRTGAARKLAAQDLDPRLTIACDLAPGAGKWRKTMDVTQHGTRRPVPIDPRLRLIDFFRIGHALAALYGELQR